MPLTWCAMCQKNVNEHILCECMQKRAEIRQRSCLSSRAWPAFPGSAARGARCARPGAAAKRRRTRPRSAPARRGQHLPWSGNICQGFEGSLLAVSKANSYKPNNYWRVILQHFSISSNVPFHTFHRSKLNTIICKTRGTTNDFGDISTSQDIIITCHYMSLQHSERFTEVMHDYKSLFCQISKI